MFDVNVSHRAYRRQITTLEAKLAFTRMQHQNVRRDSEPRKHVEAQAEMSRYNAEIIRLRENNHELEEQVDELTSMVEILRSQMGGRRSMGLVSDPTASPILLGSPNIGFTILFTMKDI